MREKKKSHWCQLAALSRSGAKLKAKDSSRIGRGEKRRKLPEPVEVTENDHGFKPAICSAVLPVRVKFPQFVRAKLLGKSFVTQKSRDIIFFGHGPEHSHVGATFCSLRLFSASTASECCH